MHLHESDPGLTTAPHISVSRETSGADPATLKAAAVGRADALSPGAVLHLQRLAGNSSVSSLLSDEMDEPSPVREVVGSGGGTPLEGNTRGFMESRLGQDFGDVRIHTGPKADESARMISAQAYTVGNDVVFQNGKFAPDSASGMRTLAHELTHVVQQRSGPVAGTPGPGGIRLSDPGDQFEQAAERTSNQVMAQTLPESATVAQAPGEDELEESSPAAAAAPAAEEREEEPEV